MKSHAVEWPKVNEVEYVDIEVPEPEEGQLLVEAVVTHISAGTERNWLTGKNDLRMMGIDFPIRPGYSFAGRVLEVGSSNSPYRPGDRIYGGTEPSGYMLGAHTLHRVVTEDSVIRIPDGVSYDTAVHCGLAGVGQHGLHIARPELGEAVAVVGLGIVGLLAVQFARLNGGAPVIAFDIDDTRREVARSLGADIVLDPRDEAATESVLADLPSGGADVVLEMTARTEPLDFAIKIAGLRARVIQMSSIEARSDIDLHRLHMKGVSLVGGFVGAAPRVDRTPGWAPGRENQRAFMELAARGRFTADQLISNRFSAPDAADAYRLVVDGAPGLIGVVLDWEGLADA